MKTLLKYPVPAVVVVLVLGISGCGLSEVEGRLQRSLERHRNTHYSYENPAEDAVREELERATVASLAKPRLAWATYNNNPSEPVIYGFWLEDAPAADALQFVSSTTGERYTISFTELTYEVHTAERQSGVVFSFAEWLPPDGELAQALRERPFEEFECSLLKGGTQVSNTVVLDRIAEGGGEADGDGGAH